MCGWATYSSVVVSGGQYVAMNGTEVSVHLALGGQCDLGLLVVEDSKYGWTCRAWIFASHVIRLEDQGEARCGWSVCAW